MIWEYSTLYIFEIVCRLILLNKLLEDGNMLYRQGHLAEASHRYRYALKRLPPVAGAGEQLADELSSQIHRTCLGGQVGRLQVEARVRAAAAVVRQKLPMGLLLTPHS